MKGISKPENNQFSRQKLRYPRLTSSSSDGYTIPSRREPERRISDSPSPKHGRSFVRPAFYDGRSVVAKISCPPRTINNFLWNPVESEYEILRKISSDYVIEAIGTFQDANGRVVLVLEDGGCDLSELTSISFSEFSTNISFCDINNLDVFLLLFSQVASGLSAIHDAEMIHRGISPKNIVFDVDKKIAKIIDFSVASTMPIVSGNLSIGTVQYMSPEQTGRIRKPTDCRTDFYALGVTMFELLTGYNPFVGVDDFGTVWNQLVTVPPPVAVVCNHIPHSVSAIIQKLLAKSPEDRYQDAQSIRFDLDQVRKNLSDKAFHVDFVPGTTDMSTKLMITSSFVGREYEKNMILEVLDDISSPSCSTEALFISGSSGVGKSALVDQVSVEVAGRKWFFFAGKHQQVVKECDEYGAFVSALNAFVRAIPAQAKDLDPIKSSLIRLLGDNASLLCSFVHGMYSFLDIDESTPVVQPLAGETVARIRDSIKIWFQCMSAESPLVFFLDDLQWMDKSTRSLISYLLTEADLHNVLFLGAYRDNEVGPESNCSLLIDELRDRSVRTRNLSLRHLSQSDVIKFLADAFSASIDEVQILGHIVYSKSLGNPLFVKSILNRLYDSSCIVRLKDGWSWDIDKILGMHFRDDVVQELVRTISSHGEKCRSVLKTIAVCGRTQELCSRELLMSAQAYLVDSIEIDSFVSELLTSLLVTNCNTYFKIAHDGVHEAVMMGMDQKTKDEKMLSIARYLYSSKDPSIMFKSMEYFSHLVYAIANNTEEALNVAKLSIAAAKSAKLATSFAKSRRYIKCGIDCLGPDAWVKEYDLCFQLHCDLGDIEYIMRNISEAKKWARLARSKAQSDFHKAYASSLMVVLLTIEGSVEDAIELGKESLEWIGVNLPSDPQGIEEAFQAEHSRAEARFQKKHLADILNSKMRDDDPVLKLKTTLLLNMGPPAYVSGSTIVDLIVAKMVNLAIEHGIYPTGAGYAFVTYASVVLTRTENFEMAEKIGVLGLQIADIFGIMGEICEANTIFIFLISHWKRPLKARIEQTDIAVNAGRHSGDNRFWGYSRMCRLLNEYQYGSNWKSLGKFCEEELQFFLEISHTTGIEAAHGAMMILETFLSPFHNKEEAVSIASSTSSLKLNEEEFLKCATSPNLRFPFATYLSLKLQLLFVLGEYRRAQLTAERARDEANIFRSIAGSFNIAEFVFYHSLVIVQLSRSSSDRDFKFNTRKWHSTVLTDYLTDMEHWARSCFENFMHKLLLLKAEMLSSTDDCGSSSIVEAISLYDQSIDLALKHEFPFDAAIANELYGQFWMRNGLVSTASNCFRRAHYMFAELGVKRKVAQMEAIYPDCFVILPIREIKSIENVEIERKKEAVEEEEPEEEIVISSSSPADFNLETITRAARTFSEKSDPGDMLEEAMNILLTNAGAQRGVLFLLKGGKLVTHAIGEVDRIDTLKNVELKDANQLCCVELIERSSKSMSPMIIDDAQTDVTYFENEYCRLNACRSMLSLPIINQTELLGVLFLENRSIGSVFVDSIMNVVILISNLLAASLEMAFRYQKLREMNSLLRTSEHKFRTLVENSPVGIILRDERDNLVYMNEAYAEVTGLNAQKIGKNRDFNDGEFERLASIVHPEDAKFVIPAYAKSKAERTGFQLEYRIILRLSITKWVNVILTPLFSDNTFLGVCTFVSDVTSQKLLNQAIPEEMVENMLQKPTLSTHHHAQTINDASIMFADIVGFTRSSDHILPVQLIHQLNSVYSAFDEAIERLGLTRLKIIGDCYLVVGGVLHRDDDHFEKMAVLALAMREIAFHYSLGGKPIQLRIGISRGPVAGGVIGTRRLVYDCWGRTVNTAKRLQEACRVDGIAVFSHLGESLKRNFIIGREHVINIVDLGETVIRNILGYRFALSTIVEDLHSCTTSSNGSSEKRSLLLDPMGRMYFDVLKQSNFMNCKHCEESNCDPEAHSLLVNSHFDASYLELLVHSFDVSGSVNQSLKLQPEMNILHLTIILNRITAVRTSLYLEIDIHRRYNRSFSPIMLAVRYASKDVLKLLFAKIITLEGPQAALDELNVKTEQGWSALHIAAAHGRSEIVSLLLEFGIQRDMDGGNGGSDEIMSPLALACFYGHEQVVRILGSKSEMDGKIMILNFERSNVKENLSQYPTEWFPEYRKLTDLEVNLMKWLLYSRGRVSCSPFSFPSSCVNTISLSFQFQSEFYSVPSIILSSELLEAGRNGCNSTKHLLIDCDVSARNSLFGSGPAESSLDHCITNCVGSHGKGLESFVFAEFFSPNYKPPKLFINRNYEKQFWNGSLTGGLSSFEGISASFPVFFDVERIDDDDYFLWEGLRIWLIPSSSTSLNQHRYCAVLFTVNNWKVVINPDPNPSSEISRFYDDADIIFANLTDEFDGKISIQSKYQEKWRKKMFSFCTEPYRNPRSGDGIRAIEHGTGNVFRLLLDQIGISNREIVSCDSSDCIPLPLPLPRDHRQHRLFFVGSGTSFSDNNTNAILESNGQRLLIDCGGTYFSSAKRLGVDPLAIDAVYISHLHLDHVGGLVDVVMARRSKNLKKLKLYISSDLIANGENPHQGKTLWENTLKTPFIHLEGGGSKKNKMENFFDVVAIDDGGSFEWNSFSLELVKTIHVMDHNLLVPTHGLMISIIDEELVEAIGKKILFTTDVKVILDLAKYLKRADIIFHDCSFKPNPVHTGFEELRRLPDDVTKKIWLMHSEKYCDDDDQEEVFDMSKFAGVVLPGQSFDIGKLGTYVIE